MTAPSSQRRVQLPNCWLEVLGPEFEQPYMADLRAFLREEMQAATVFPPSREIFNAFWLTRFHGTRVVILGQDPYHNVGQAHGLCFSVKKGVMPPPSLQNIFRELAEDVGMPRPSHGDLSSWARQGVLLLNTVLTVRAHQANSHRGRGWERLTDRVIEELNARHDGLVFVLWGAAAGKKASMIDSSRHRVLKSPHPSPLSAHRGFFGCRHFSTINAHLAQLDEDPIDWQLRD